MSDMTLAKAKRDYAAEPSWSNKLALWVAQARAGELPPSSSWPDVEIIQPGSLPSGENAEEATYRPAVPGADVPTGPFEVAHVLWGAEEDEAWTYYNSYWLIQTTDGRFASISSLSSGTCSWCSNASYDVAFAWTLAVAVQFGMSQDARRLAGLELQSDSA